MEFRKKILFALAILLPGCGVGLCVKAEYCDSQTVPRLLLSGIEGLSIRKNDCYPVTLSAIDAAGNPLTDVNATVALTVSSGVELYSSLAGCQTYDSQFEQYNFSLSPQAPQTVFYFRSDVEGSVLLAAATSPDTGLAEAHQVLSVQFTAFDRTDGPSSGVDAVTQDSIGRTYLGGDFQTYDDTGIRYVARLSSDGSLDTAFASAGSGFDAQVRCLALQTDGRLLVGGPFSFYNGTSRRSIARLNSDGSLDPSFAPTGTGLNGDVRAIAIQNDGKVVVAGGFFSYNGTSQPYVARLNPDGSLDSSFAPTGTGLSGSAESIVLQSDGKLVVGGSFLFYNGTSRPYVARLNIDGSLDATFGPTGTGLGSSVQTAVLQTDGKVLVGGLFTSYNGTTRRYVARLDLDGSLDTTFVPTGTGLNGMVFSATLQTDGKIILGGVFTSYDGTLSAFAARLQTDGSFDTSFATGIGFTSSVVASALQNNGSILFGGDFLAYNGTSRPHLARLNTNGSLDSNFAASASGLDASLWSTCVQPDGKVMVGGTFLRHNGTFRQYIARVNNDGSLDTGFATLTPGLNNLVYTVSLQPDGKPIVGGLFTSYNGTFRSRIARLTTDGSLDTSFTQTGPGLNGAVQALVLQSDVASRPYIARLNTDGTIDTSFAQTGSGLSSAVWALGLQPDGKVLVGGVFTSYNGTSRTGVARLHSDGTLDTSFALTGTGLNNSVWALALQNDGKVIVGGTFTSYDGVSRTGVARLNSDGSLDTSFALTGAGLNSSVRTLALQADGRILVSGPFTLYDGTSRAYLARLRNDGALDTSFASSGTGLDQMVLSFAELPDSKIVVGGQFTSYQNRTVRYLARLTPIGTID